MKSLSKLLVTLILGVGLMGCNDDPDPVPGNHNPKPNPQEPVEQKENNSFRLEFDGLPQASTGMEGRYLADITALISVTDANNIEKISSQRLSLYYSNGKYYSDSVILVKGDHHLTKLLIFNQENKVDLLTPLVNTHYGNQIQNPLPLEFTLTGKAQEILKPELVVVVETELPQSYGYTADSLFSNHFINIGVKAIVSVGQVIYDYIPAEITITGNLENEAPWTDFQPLNPGENTLLIPKKYPNYTFSLQKWGLEDEYSLATRDIQEGMIIVLGGNITPKLLRTVTDYKFNQENQYEIQSKNEYHYNPDNRLALKEYFQINIQTGELQLMLKSHYEYENDLLTKVTTNYPDGEIYDEDLYTYNEERRLSTIHKNMYYANLSADASFYYDPLLRTWTRIYYTFSNGMSYVNNFVMRFGNKVNYSAAGESGLFWYDYNINPYYQWNITDFHHSHSSKNNLIKEERSYSGNFPTLVVDNISYIYDEQGFPMELRTTYKTYMNGYPAGETKSVFEYMN